ncbi:MAG: HlyD family efflux transporter periplasmic adaptor subunit [Caldimonas sp.]
MPLFRQQALDHVGVRRYGTVVLARPVTFTFITSIFVLFATLIVLFLALFSYQRKVQVGGVLLPESGLIRVVPSQAGVVVERSVREGKEVRAGDPMFVLTSERASATRGDAEQAISGLLRSRRESLVIEQGQLRQQSLQRVEAAERRAVDLSHDIERIDSQIALQQRRVVLSDQALQRFADLQQQNFVSSANVQDKQGELLDQRQRLADLERLKASGARDLASVQADRRDLKIQSQRDQENASRGIAELDQDLTENEARRQIVVRSPQDGVVTAINAELGQTVGPGQALASVLPKDTPLIAELYAPSRAVGFVRPGMDVLVRFQAYPYQKFGQHHGTVREVSSTAMRPEDMALPGAVETSGLGEPVYRVRVALDEQVVRAYGDARPLKSGMVLDASVLLEKRRLYEWVLEPLYTITGRL